MNKRFLTGLSIAILSLPVPVMAQGMNPYQAQQQAYPTVSPYNQSSLYMQQQQTSHGLNGLLYADPTNVNSNTSGYMANNPYGQSQYSPQQMQYAQQMQQQQQLQQLMMMQQQGMQLSPQQMQQMQQLQMMRGGFQSMAQPQYRYNNKRGPNYFAGVELPKRLFNNIPPRRF